MSPGERSSRAAMRAKAGLYIALSLGTRVVAYEILSFIGRSVMGEVWKARDTRRDRLVAVKSSSPRALVHTEREKHVATNSPIVP